MPQKSKNRFEVTGDTFTIMRDGWNSVALATIREDYNNELTSHIWGLSKGYPSNATLGGGLHRYMMTKWYGDDVLRDLTEKKLPNLEVIDILNAQSLLGINGRVQVEDQLNLVRFFETEEKLNQFEKDVDNLVKAQVQVAAAACL